MACAVFRLFCCSAAWQGRSGGCSRAAALAALVSPAPLTHTRLAPARPHPQVALAALSVVICYADRSNISTAILPMADQYGWATGQQGLILSQFFLGYLLTQLLGGEARGR